MLVGLCSRQVLKYLTLAAGGHGAFHLAGRLLTVQLTTIPIALWLLAHVFAWHLFFAVEFAESPR